MTIQSNFGWRKKKTRVRFELKTQLNFLISPSADQREQANKSGKGASLSVVRCYDNLEHLPIRTVDLRWNLKMFIVTVTLCEDDVQAVVLRHCSVPDGVHSQDLESGVYYSLWWEVAAHKQLQSRQLAALRVHVHHLAEVTP